MGINRSERKQERANKKCYTHYLQLSRMKILNCLILNCHPALYKRKVPSCASVIDCSLVCPSFMERPRGVCIHELESVPVYI